MFSLKHPHEERLTARYSSAAEYDPAGRDVQRAADHFRWGFFFSYFEKNV